MFSKSSLVKLDVMLS